MSDVTRKDFLIGLVAAGGAVAVPASDTSARPRRSSVKRPRAIAMWDFSWLERRWPGAGYEDWDQALNELVERGYDAVRIDAYPHLVAADPEKSWLLKPLWNTQDWGAPGFVRVSVVPALHEFIAKCRDRGIKVALSTWYREDEDNVRMKIVGPEHMASIWKTTLAGIKRAGLLETILCVDLCNEWPGPPYAPFVKPPLDWPDWSKPQSMQWMRTAIAAVRAAFPELPLLFSTNIDRVESFFEQDISFYDAIDHHVWMAGENDDEFNKVVGYNYETFSDVGYRNLQLNAARSYGDKPAYWRKLLTDKIARLAVASKRAGQPLMTTECWAIVDYKDWPLLPWGWVKDVCALGTLSAAATGRWAAISTSNFCGPQFQGMWRDVAWHQRLTRAIKAAPVDADVRASKLWGRL
jgi:Sugar-binding cellulase-like